jgi:hypothetical protein
VIPNEFQWSNRELILCKFVDNDRSVGMVYTYREAIIHAVGGFSR